jgi:hypothetical protein
MWFMFNEGFKVKFKFADFAAYSSVRGANHAVRVLVEEYKERGIMF